MHCKLSFSEVMSCVQFNKQVTRSVWDQGTTRRGREEYKSEGPIKEGEKIVSTRWKMNIMKRFLISLMHFKTLFLDVGDVSFIC